MSRIEGNYASQVADRAFCTTSQDMLEALSVNAKKVVRSDVSNFHEAEQVLLQKCPGTFLIFSDSKGQCYFSMVKPGGHVEHKPFSKIAECSYKNGGAHAWSTVEGLFEHLLDGQFGIPYYSPEALSSLNAEEVLKDHPAYTGFAYATNHARNTFVFKDEEGEIHAKPFNFNEATRLWDNGGAVSVNSLQALCHGMMRCQPHQTRIISPV